MTEPSADSICHGMLHLFVAFDWGDGVNLAAAQQLVPSESHSLARRRRTPPSIDYRPRPLRLALEPLLLPLEMPGQVPARGELTIFDFGAVSAAWHIPFHMSRTSLTQLANSLTLLESAVQAIRQHLEPLFIRLQPAIDAPCWSDLTEEYCVFELQPDGLLPRADLLSGELAGWLAGLVRLDDGPLGPDEIAEALRLRLSYSPADCFVPDWPAAVLIDRDCEETLAVIEFANLQLLEYRFIDHRLDDDLATAGRLIHGLSRSWLPFWRTHARPLRVLGELKLEANTLFERTGNVLKLVGDQYLARVYRLLAGRFHIEEWERSIQRKLEVMEGTYRILSDQGATYRNEFLESVIVLLIVVEIVLTLMRH